MIDVLVCLAMDACKPLQEYAWLVDRVRKHQAEKMDLDAAIDATVDEMPDVFVIRGFIIANRAEVKTMLLTEYNEEKVMEKERQEGSNDTGGLELLQTCFRKVI